MKYIFCILIGYLIGAINPSYFIAKLRGFDIREKGSKNAGASNALILFGKVLGVGCALFDLMTDMTTNLSHALRVLQTLNSYALHIQRVSRFLRLPA